MGSGLAQREATDVRKVMKQILTRTNPGLKPPGPSGHNVLAPRV